MTPWKHIISRLAGAIVLVLVLLASLLLLLAHLSDREWFRDRIAGEASALVGGKMEIGEADLGYWPRPRLAIRGATLAVPGAVTGTIRSLTAYPRLLPLLRGEVRISELRLESASFDVTLPERSSGAPQKEEGGAAPASLGETLRTLLDSMSRSAPDLRLVLADVRATVSGRNLPPLSFRGIKGYVVLPPAGPELDLSLAGTLWEQGSVKGRFDAGSLAGGGRIVLRRFRPHLLAGPVLADSGWGISDSEIDLDIRVETGAEGKLHAGGDVSFPRMTLSRGERRMELAGGTIRGTLDRDGGRVAASITRLSLASPRLLVSGNLFLDREARRSRADAQARQVDIASVREHALALAKDVPLVGRIFSIVKAGTIPELVFRAEGETAADLRRFENMEFTGAVFDGGIRVDARNAVLEIDRIRGNLALLRGFLTASDLSGNMGKIAAHRGTLRMGFLGADPPFHLEADVSADVSGLPPLLGLLIPSDPFRKELSLTSEWEGNVSGKMTLGETLGSIRAAVEVDAMRFSARYRRLPHPLEVSGGRLLYRSEEIAGTGVGGAMGKSAFSDLSWNIRLADPPSLDVRSGTFRLSLDELYPWARATEGLREFAAGIRGASGTSAISVIRLAGPFFSPGKWTFDVSGNVERLSLATASVPGAIDVASGKFRATPDTLSFEDLRTKFLDASVTASGSLEGYRTDVRRGAAVVSGRLGPEAIAFLHDRGKVPSGVTVQPPLEASGARLEWVRDSLVALRGNFSAGNGPEISVDFIRSPGEWAVRDLSIRDEGSRASLSLRRKRKSLDLAFEGFLSGETVQRIFASGSPPGESLSGNFRASLRFDEPAHSTAEGTLAGRNLRFPRMFGVPVLLDDLSLSAEGNRVTVRTAEVSMGDLPVHWSGEATVSPDGFLFDMDASTDGIDWERLTETLRLFGAREKPHDSEEDAGERAWPPPFRGTVRLRSGYFRIGRHIVEPAAAEIRLGKTGMTAAVTDAAYCGIPFTGTIRRTRGNTSFDLRPNAGSGDLGAAYECLTEEQGRVTGTFDLTGEVSGRVREGEEPLRSLRGKLTFTAGNGRIHGIPILSRILALLNVTEVFRGTLPDMTKDGLEIVSLSARGEIRDGRLTITESVLDGTTVDMVGQGRIDLSTRESKLQILVAPFKTADYIIGKIPLLGRILGGTLVEVPVEVTGTIADPKVSLLEPAAVGKNLLGVVERTFRLPVELIRPVLPGEKTVDR